MVKPPATAAPELLALGRIRIIGGHWRGCLLPVPSVASLRPTSARMRETLFNWLAADIHGARCLDLFAGSGILGFEAVSRGASQVTLIERDSRLYRHLREQQLRLPSPALRLVRADACLWLQDPANLSPFDVIFIDPPFRQDLVARCCALLRAGEWLSKTACVYVESEPGLVTPANWRVCRQTRAGRVWCRLLRPCQEIPLSGISRL